MFKAPLVFNSLKKVCAINWDNRKRIIIIAIRSEYMYVVNVRRNHVRGNKIALLDLPMPRIVFLVNTLSKHAVNKEPVF